MDNFIQNQSEGCRNLAAQDFYTPKTEDTDRKEKENGAAFFRYYGIRMILYAAVYTFCLYRNPSGITWPVMIIATLWLFADVMKKMQKENRKDEWFYRVSLLLIGISQCTTANETVQTCNVMAAFLLFTVLVVRNFSEAWKDGISLTSYIGQMFQIWFRPIGLLGRPFSDPFHFVVDGKTRTGENGNTARDVMIGILISIPLLALILTLLSSADPIFGNLLNGMISGIVFPAHFGTVFNILFMAFVIYLAGYCMICFLQGHTSEIKTEKLEKAPALIAMIFSGMLTAVYLVFSVVQMISLLAGQMALPQGYSYSEYVHEGFGQLLAVCLINLILLTATDNFFTKNRILDGILTVMCGCTYIMATSAIVRIFMYVAAYRLTFYRVLVIWTIIVVYLCLTLLTFHIYMPELPVFRYCVGMITVMYLLLALGHPDYWIAEYNLAGILREHQGMITAEMIEQDGSLQASLSDLNELSQDAVPAIMKNPQIAQYYMEQHSVNPEKYTFDSVRCLNLSELTAQKLLRNK